MTTIMMTMSMCNTGIYDDKWVFVIQVFMMTMSMCNTGIHDDNEYV